MPSSTRLPFARFLGIRAPSSDVEHREPWGQAEAIRFPRSPDVTSDAPMSQLIESRNHLLCLVRACRIARRFRVQKEIAAPRAACVTLRHHYNTSLHRLSHVLFAHHPASPGLAPDSQDSRSLAHALRSAFSTCLLFTDYVVRTLPLVLCFCARICMCIYITTARAASQQFVCERRDDAMVVYEINHRVSMSTKRLPCTATLTLYTVPSAVSTLRAINAVLHANTLSNRNKGRGPKPRLTKCGETTHLLALPQGRSS